MQFLPFFLVLMAYLFLILVHPMVGHFFPLPCPQQWRWTQSALSAQGAFFVVSVFFGISLCRSSYRGAVPYYVDKDLQFGARYVDSVPLYWPPLEPSDTIEKLKYNVIIAAIIIPVVLFVGVPIMKHLFPPPCPQQWHWIRGLLSINGSILVMSIFFGIALFISSHKGATPYYVSRKRQFGTMYSNGIQLRWAPRTEDNTEMKLTGSDYEKFIVPAPYT